MPKRNLGPLSSFPPVPGETGRILSFTFQVGWRSSQFWLKHRTWRPRHISGSRQLVVNHLQWHFHLCFIEQLCHHGKTFLFAVNHQASEPAPGGGGGVRLAKDRASRDWLRFGFSGLQSLFSVYRGINHGFQIGLPGRQQDWLKKAEVLSLGFFHALMTFQQENKGIWFLQYSLSANYCNLANSDHSSQFKYTWFRATEVRCFRSFRFGQHKSDSVVFD